MRRFLAVLFVVLVVSSAVLASPGAAATWGVDTGDCDELDEFLWVVSFGLFNQQCDSSSLSQEKQELEDDMANQTRTSVYNTGKVVETTWDQFDQVMGNHMQNSETVAMSKAEAAAIEAIDSGATKSATQTAATDAVADYYTVKEMNLADRWSVTAETTWTLENTTEVAGLNGANDFIYWSTEGDGVSSDHDIIGVGTNSVTLQNGSSYSVSAIRLRWDDNGQNRDDYVDLTTTDASDNNVIALDDPIIVRSISGTTSYELVPWTEYRSRWNEIDSEETRVSSNANEYAGAIYDAYQNGTIDNSTYVSGATLAQEYSTDYNDTGYYAYAVAYSATGGFSIPNLNGSSLMEIQTGSGTYQGLIMSQNAPNNGTWEVGTTYDASTIAGKQFVARTDGNVTELTGQFTINSMEDEDGNAIENTSVQTFDYGTANTSEEFAALQEEIRHLQTEINEEDPSTVPGGSSGSGGLGNLGLIGIAAVAILAGGALLTGGGSSVGSRRRGRR